MSKSAGNTIPIFAEPDEIRRLVMSMVTDPQRIKRTDPGRPEVCNVCQLHRFFGADYVQIQDGERTARTGCVETKQLLAERIIEHFRPMRERRAELAADGAVVEETLAAGRRTPCDRSSRRRWPRFARPSASVPTGDLGVTGPPATGSVLASAGGSSSSWRSEARTSPFLLLDRALGVVGGFGSILLILFLAWLLAFVMSAGRRGIEQRLDAPRPSIVIGTYRLALVVFGFVVFYTGAAITQQVAELAENYPAAEREVLAVLADWERGLQFGRIRLDLTDLYAERRRGLAGLGRDIIQQPRTSRASPSPRSAPCS